MIQQSLQSPSHPIHQVKVELTACLGSVSLTVGDLSKIREHQVIRLDTAIDQPVDLLMDGQVVARGTLVAVEDHFGIRISELPLPLQF